MALTAEDAESPQFLLPTPNPVAAGLESHPEDFCSDRNRGSLTLSLLRLLLRLGSVEGNKTTMKISVVLSQSSWLQLPGLD